MARVTFEYELPAEQEAVEAAIMGRESARVIAALDAWLLQQQLEYERKVRGPGSSDQDLGFLRGLSEARARLRDEITRNSAPPAQRAEEEGDDDAVP